MAKSYLKISNKNNCPTNSRIAFPFFSNEFIDFSESMWNFSIFFHVYENTVFEKKSRLSYATVGSMTRKILTRDMKSCYKKISKIRNLKLIFQNFDFPVQKLKENGKNVYGFWKINK